MMDLVNEFQSLALTLLNVSILLFLTGVFIFYKNRENIQRSGIALLLSTSLWSMFYANTLWPYPLNFRIFWFLLKLAFDSIVLTIFFLYIVDFLDINMNDYQKCIVCLPQLCILPLIFTNHIHKIVCSSYVINSDNFFNPIIIKFNFGFWFIIVYNYALLIITLYFIYKISRNSLQLYKIRITELLFCIIIPLITHLIHIFNFIPYNINLTPLITNLVTVAILWVTPHQLDIRDVISNSYKSVFNSLYDAVFIVESQDYVLDMNDSAKTLVKFNSKINFNNKRYRWNMLFKNNDRNKIQDEFNEISLFTKDYEYTYDVNVSIIEDWLGRVDHKIIILRDITERKNYEKKLEDDVEEQTRLLRNAERMAAIGETAAMVGHDLRNPLQVIVGSLNFIKRRLGSLSEEVNLPQVEQIEDLVEKVTRQTGYMNKIVSDLQDYAKPIVPACGETDLEELFNDMMPAIEVPGNVALSMSFEEGLPTIWADGGLLLRVFTNLVTNAIQAMPEGGDLRVECGALGGEVSVSVEDTGVGISEEAQANLFKPLITTKPKGMGLGLPVCKRMIEVHNGRIEVESEVGVGTTFTVRLPIGAGERPVQQPPDAESLVPPGSKLRV